MKFIKSLVLLFLFLANITESQVSVYGRVDHLVPDGIDTLGNITLTVSGSTAPYTYTWNPGTINTKDISNIHIGQYTVNVKSASSQTYTAKYNLGYKVNWTNLDKCYFSNDSLVSTSASPAFFSKAVSKNTLLPNTDGWFEYVLDVLPTKNGYFGFTDSISPSMGTFKDIDFGFYFNGGNPATIFWCENGPSTLNLTSSAKIGDVIRVERIGNVINYKINEVIKRTVTVSGLSQKTLKLKAAPANGLKLINIGCSFYQDGNVSFPNYIDETPVIKHLTGIGTNDGSISITPELSGTYTYTWQSSGSNTNSITNQAIGVYKVTLEDAIHNKSSKYYNIGYKVNWTDLDRCYFRNDSLVSTTTSAAVFSNAVSKNTLLPNTNGWFEYILDVLPTKNGYFGFTDSISPNKGTYKDIDFGFYFNGSNMANIYWSETDAYSVPVTYSSKVGDIIRIERVGDTINYKINGGIVKTTIVSGLSQKTLKLKAATANGLKLINLGCSFYQYGDVSFPNYIEAIPTIKHLTGAGINDGSINLSSEVQETYTYTWQPSGSNSNPIINEAIGQYKVSIEDSIHAISSKYYNIGYKVNWTDLDRCYFRNDSLVSTTTNAVFFSKAVSKNTLSPNIDGWFEYVLNALPGKPCTFGFLDSISPNTNVINDVDFGIHFNGTNQGYMYAYENGTIYILTYTLKIGDILRVERIGDAIKYKINGIILKTTTVSGLAQKTLKLKAGPTFGLKLINLGCSFYQDGNVNFQNYVELISLIKHSSGQGINDGSITVTPRLSGLQSYNWQPSNQTTNPICGLSPGSNTVTVTDSIANQSSHIYNTGYKTSWTNVSTGFFRNDTLKATAVSSGYNYAFTKNTLSANTDGWFEYIMPPLTGYNNYIGFVDSAANNSSVFTDIQFGFYYQGSNKYLYAYEGGTISILNYLSRAGDVLRVERLGNTIYYKINEVTVRTITNAATGAKVLKLKAKLGNQNYLTHIGISEPPCRLNMNAGSNHTITCSNPTTVLSGTSTVSGVTYSWTPGGSTSTSYSTTVSGAGTYTLKVTDASGCSSAATMAVISNTAIPTVSITNSPTITVLNPTVTLTGTSTTSGATYSWMPGGTTPTSNTTSVVSGGVYTLTVTNPGNGCVASNTVLIMEKILNATVIKEHVTIENPYSGIIGIVATGGKGTCNYTWSDVSENTNIRTGLKVGDYHVIVRDSLNDSLSIQVSIGLKNRWRLQKDIIIANDNIYLDTIPSLDSAGILVSNNSLPANSEGWTELTVLEKNQSVVFGFLGFNANQLDANSSTPFVSDQNLNTSLLYADSIVYKRFPSGAGTPSATSDAKYNNIHLVELVNGDINIRFKGYSSGTLYTYKTGDVFKMQRTDSVIKLYQNNNLIATENFKSDSQHLLNALFVKSDTAIVGYSGSFANTGNNVVDARTYYCADNDLNWVSSVSYDENGVVKSESKVYMDFLGRTIQTQSKLLSSANVLVSEPIYDGYGRAVGQTLPAPSFKDLFCYIPHFVQLGENSINAIDYTHQFFDNPIGVSTESDILPIDDFNALGDINHPYPVDNSNVGTLGWYYSDNNTSENLVAADAMPYSRVEFYNDPLGRPRRVSGVGEQHSMGSNHESKFIYTSTPAVTNPDLINELNYVFPHRTYELEKDFSVNATVAKNVNRNLQLFKTIAINPDGKDQITYTNSGGKTIATCITGDGSGCVTHTDIKQLYAANTQKTIETIYIPKLKAGTFKFFEQVKNANGTTTQLFSNFTPVLKDALNGTDLIIGTDFTYNSSNGEVTFLGNYVNKSLYLQLGFSLGNYNPQTHTINASVDVDYTQWTLYFYDRKGRLLANAAPNDVVCQTIPYSIQKTSQTGSHLNTAIVSQNVGYARASGTPNPPLSFDLNSTVLNTTDKDIYFYIDLQADTIFNFNADSLNLDIFTEPIYEAIDSTFNDSIFNVITDSVNIFMPDTTYFVNQEFDSLSVAYYHLGDTIYTPPTQNIVLNRKIRYQGYYEVYAVLADSSKVRLDMDTIPFDYGVEAVSYDSLSGGVVCRVFGYQGISTGPKDPIHHEPIPEGPLPDLPITTTRLEFVPHGNLISNGNLTAVSEYGEDGTGGYHPPHSGDGLLAAATQFNGGIFINTYDPVPIPVNLANKYMYDEFDRLIGSESADEGRVDYVYDQLEDKLLFTQNDKQRANGGKFSCIAYDKLGRVNVTGEYYAATGGYQFQTYDQYFKHPVAAASGKTSIGVPALSNNTLVYNDGHMNEKTFIEYDNADASLPTPINQMNTAQKYTAAKVSKTYNDKSTTWYSYDELGRQTQSVSYSDELGYKTIKYFTDFRGKLILSNYQSSQTDLSVHIYGYDADERLTTVYFGSSANNSLNVKATYEYYLHGPLKRSVIGGNLQGLDYVYTIGGMLKSVNNPNSTLTNLDPGMDGYATGPNAAVSPDAFGFALQYYKDDYKRTGSPVKSYDYTSAFNGSNVSYSGLIKNTTWRTTLPIGAPANYSDALMYEYNYDDLYQLTNAQFGSVVPTTGTSATFSQLSEYKVDNLTYDKNGNMQSLRRYAAPINSSSAHLLDDLTYNYSSTLKNRLLNVGDVSTNTGSYTAEFDLPNQTDNANYVYNQIGELIQNKQENQGFEYNASGLTTKVYNLTNSNNIVTFTYNDKGLRHSKTSYNNLGAAIKATYYSYDAGGSQIATYTKALETTDEPLLLQDLTVYGAGRLGVYDAVSQKVMYELTDHLGNTRAVVAADANGDAETISYTDYYPHGGVLPGRSYVNTLGVPYAYQGMEKDAETGLQNFELRQYDPRLGRWYNPDPMGQHHSPYLSMSNNPISMIDPDGGYDVNGGINIDPRHGSDDDFANAQFNHGSDHQSFESWMNHMEVQERKAQDMSDYLHTISKYEKRNGQYGTYVVTSEGQKLFVPLKDQPVNPRTRPEYSGAGGQTIRGPVNNSTGTGGYNVTVSPRANYLKWDDGSVHGFVDDNSIYRWNANYNAYYSESKNEIYGGVGVNLVNAYMQSTTGANFGQSAHPSSDIGIGLGKIQNGINTVASIGNLTNLGIVGVRGMLRLSIPVYRVIGGAAKLSGKSYTIFNPALFPKTGFLSYRNLAGLPSTNTGTFLMKGSVQIKNIKIGRMFAAPLNGNSGGLPFELYLNPGNTKLMSITTFGH